MLFHITNKIKLSPQTNHRGTRKGAIKGGFDRTEFFKNSEKTFDKDFNHSRDFKESFDFQNTMKNGKMEEVKQLPEREKEFNQERERFQEVQEERKQEQSQEQDHSHDNKQEQSHEYEEEQEQTQRRGRGM